MSAEELAPETVTQALEALAALGYVDELVLRPDGLATAGRSDLHSLESAVVDHRFRFEGPSDPADESIVLGVRCPSWGTRGVVVAAYGPAADPAETEALLALSRPPAGG